MEQNPNTLLQTQTHPLWVVCTIRELYRIWTYSTQTYHKYHFKETFLIPTHPNAISYIALHATKNKASSKPFQYFHFYATNNHTTTTQTTNARNCYRNTTRRQLKWEREREGNHRNWRRTTTMVDTKAELSIGGGVVRDFKESNCRK